MSSVQDSHVRHSDSSGRPNKRRKVAIACDECRARKVRCDGRQPGAYCLTCVTLPRDPGYVANL